MNPPISTRPSSVQSAPPGPAYGENASAAGMATASGTALHIKAARAIAMPLTRVNANASNII